MSQFREIAEQSLREEYRQLDQREEELKDQLELVRAAKAEIGKIIFKPNASTTNQQHGQSEIGLSRPCAS